jgi:hypothetical protein
MITLSALWHVLGFAFGLVYIHFSLKSLLGIIPYDRSWTKVIRSADVHLWLSGFALIGLGILHKGFEFYLSNPKLWCKITVVVVWFLSTQAMRSYAVPKLQQGNIRPMLKLSAINVACWIYGALLGCAKPLGYGVVSYPEFLAGFAIMIALSFVALQKIQRLRRTSTSSTSISGAPPN